MMGKTHLAAGGLFGAAALVITKEMDPILGATALCFASMGSLTPDIDHPMSTIAQKNMVMGALSRFASGISSHRRFWHTPIACLGMAMVVMILMYAVGNVVSEFIDIKEYILPLTMYFLLGELSHLVMDSLNPQGVPWLYPIQPLNKKFHVPVVSTTTGTPLEMVYRGISIIGTVYLLYLWGKDSGILEQIKGASG